jgi:penicillin-binding protein 1A
MASAYGVFADRGLRAEPTPVLKVTDRDGKVLIDNTKPKTTRILKQDVADNVTDILQGVLQSGTAAGRGLGDRPAAGKTGTTQNSRDAWFVGYTPTLSTAVWMGYKNAPGQPPQVLRNIKGVGAVTGGTHPARVWQAFMTSALKDVPITQFTEPAPIKSVPDAAKLRQRGGFAPGNEQSPADLGGGETYVVEPPEPNPEAPTTTVPFLPSTTTTTTPRGIFRPG